MIAADEGAEIIYGHNAKSREELRQQIEKKEWDKLLTKVPVKAGDFSMFQAVLCTPLDQVF